MKNKNWIYLTTVFVIIFTIFYLGQVKSETTPEFSSFVDKEGNISRPTNFRESWEYLGAWVVPEKADGTKTDGYGFHDVFASSGSIASFNKETKMFADGTVLVKEVRSIDSASMTTGPKVMFAGSEILWFVMIKDEKGRFKDNPNWGDGWGWALFLANDKTKNVSTNYKKDCLGCHVPAKNTDWIYLQGYPVLK
ncbi:MAG: cytochrome P460 family protein [Thermodesulfobacteriota bacterium]